MQTLLLQMTERLIVESLAKGPKTLSELHHDTALAYGLINNLISQMQFKKMISYQSGKYLLHEEIESSLMSHQYAVHLELKEIMTSLLNQYFEDNKSATLKIQKVWMDESEEKIFNSYLINMEKFLDGLKMSERRYSRQKTIKDKKVIVWGHTNYAQLVEQSLKAI